jgi:glycosyltransferase involved in cell wall biosynthesis
VLHLTNILTEYNLPILQRLGEKVDLTVIHAGKSLRREGLSFVEQVLQIYKVGPFSFTKENLYPLACRYDVLLISADIKWLSYMRLAFYKNRPFGICFWGIGVSASYTKHFDEIKHWDRVRNFFMSRADSLVFYSDYPIKKYIEAGFDRAKLFVAPNTVEVKDISSNIEKDILLFVGSLYKQKGVDKLFESYYRACKKHPIPDLHVIGGGNGYGQAKDWVESHGLNERIHLHGPIYNEERLAVFFQRSFACISPGQSGLTVLKSMGYGTPFITMRNSFTGGERLNIEDGVNGVLYSDEGDLEVILIDIALHKQKYILMGEKARKYYLNCRTPQHMVNGLFNAIQYAIRKVPS